jgi:hypothetical protein
MARPKVYLSRSNMSNPDEVARVRQILSCLNVEIVEWKGGQYSHDPITDCDAMIMVIPDMHSYNVGRGQTEQLQHALSCDLNVYCVKDIYIEDGHWRMSVEEVRDYMPIEKDWKRDWAELETNEMPIDIINYSEFSYKKGATMPKANSVPETRPVPQLDPVKPPFKVHLAAIKLFK